MTADLNEAEIGKRLERYATHFNIENADIDKTDITCVLAELEDQINQLVAAHQLFMCLRKTKCKCADDCDCDSDLYVSVVNATLNLSSNCTYQMNFSLNNDIRKVPAKYGLRFFALDKADTETVVCDIRHDEVYVHSHKMIFKAAEGIDVRNNTVFTSFNYLSFDKKLN